LKLIIFGGGSLNTPAFFSALTEKDKWLEHIQLVDQSAESVEKVGKFCEAVLCAKNLPIGLTWDTDLRPPATGANIILSMIEVGGLEAVEKDQKRLAVSGVVGHAATYPQVIRNLPATLEAAKVVESSNPAALWVNFSNPVTILCEAIALHTNLRCIGICYHSFLMYEDFAKILGVEEGEIKIDFSGLNHLGWVTDVKVNGLSQMGRLVDLIRKTKDKKYNYWYAEPGLIPIDHAFSLYHKGDLWFDRQKGIRGSLKDILQKSGISRGNLNQIRTERARLQQIINEGQLADLDKFHLCAPWYRKCIVPFLRKLVSGDPHELLLTWKHDKAVPFLPSLTGESAAVLRGNYVQPTPTGSRLPEFAVEWLNQVRASENLLIQAVIDKSRGLLAQALAIHPNVVSFRHAQRFASYYFND
jgi:6-phospho-beta-glucosidase